MALSTTVERELSDKNLGDIGLLAARTLGTRWHFTRGHHPGYGNLIRDDGLTLGLYNDQYRKRYTVSLSQSDLWVDTDGGTADPYNHNEDRPSMNVGYMKDGKRIAADITRRLLPDCEAPHKRALVIVAGRNETYAKRDSIGVALGLGAARSHPHSSGVMNSTEHYKIKKTGVDDCPTLDVEVTQYGVRLKSSYLDAKQVQAVFKALGIDPKKDAGYH